MSEAPGVIEAGSLYTAREARERLGIGLITWRELKKEGMKVYSRGKHQFVLGDELIRVLSVPCSESVDSPA
jgi:hypothetical protein